MVEKRFKYHEETFHSNVDEETGEEIKYYSPQIHDNGELIYDGRKTEDVESICKLLNDLNDLNVEYYKENFELKLLVKQWEELDDEKDVHIKSLINIIKDYNKKTFKVINYYSKLFKRHSKEFSFMIDIAEDLGIKGSELEAIDD